MALLNDLMVRPFKYEAAASYRCSVYKDLRDRSTDYLLQVLLPRLGELFLQFNPYLSRKCHRHSRSLIILPDIVVIAVET